MLDVVPLSFAVGGAITRPWQPRPQRHEVTTLDEFTAFSDDGWVKYLIDFRLESRSGGVQLSTETRGHATDQRSRRLFALYWALIRPCSGLVRRDMLATVDRLARARPSTTSPPIEPGPV